MPSTVAFSYTHLDVYKRQVRIFEVVPVNEGVALSKVVLQRADLEELEFTAGQDAILHDRAEILAIAGAQPEGAVMGKGLYPKLDWGFAPYMRTALFDPDNPLRINVGLRANLRYDIAPGLVFSGAITKKLAGNLGNSTRISTSPLPHVRSESNIYDREGDPALENLTLAWYAKPAPNLYSRVTLGLSLIHI